MIEPLLTAEQLAEQLGCEPDHVKLLASKHQLPAVKFGRSWRFPPAALTEFLNDQALRNLEQVNVHQKEPLPPRVARWGPRKPIPDLTKTVQAGALNDASPARRKAAKHSQ